VGLYEKSTLEWQRGSHWRLHGWDVILVEDLLFQWGIAAPRPLPQPPSHIATTFEKVTGIKRISGLGIIEPRRQIMFLTPDEQSSFQTDPHTSFSRFDVTWELGE
jgi:hypothetical protein